MVPPQYFIQTQMWSRPPALHSFNLGARWVDAVSSNPRPFYPKKDYGTNFTGDFFVLSVGLNGYLDCKTFFPTGV